MKPRPRKNWIARLLSSIVPRRVRSIFTRRARSFRVKKVRPKMRVWSTVADALSLQKELHEGVTGNHGNGLLNRESDVRKIRRLCTEGLRDQLIPLIINRQQNQYARWEIKGAWPHIKSRVVSNQVANLPRDNCSIRQAVVKISSQQRILRYDELGDGTRQLVLGSDKWEPMMEYLVLQKRIIDGTEEAWRIWGMVEESSYLETLEITPSVGTDARGAI